MAVQTARVGTTTEADCLLCHSVRYRMIAGHRPAQCNSAPVIRADKADKVDVASTDGTKDIVGSWVFVSGLSNIWSMAQATSIIQLDESVEESPATPAS